MFVIKNLNLISCMSCGSKIKGIKIEITNPNFTTNRFLELCPDCKNKLKFILEEYNIEVENEYKNK